MFKFSKGAAAAAAMACAWAGSATATTQVYLQTAGIYDPGTITEGGRDVLSSDVIFRANVGSSAQGAGFDLIGFCVDLAHSIATGINAQAALGLTYHVAPLLTDSNGTTLTAAQRTQIGGLANLGFAIQAANGSDKAIELAAIQGAIWTVEYPSISVSAADGNLATRLAYYVALAPSLHGSARAIYADNPATQGFVVGGPVPEPASWALLIGGFGLTGAALRRRRVALTA